MRVAGNRQKAEAAEMGGLFVAALQCDGVHNPPFV